MGETDRDREIRELRARLDALQAEEPGLSISPAQAAAKPQTSKLGCGFFGAVGLLLLVGFFTQNASTPSGESAADLDRTPAWVPPTGYERHSTRTGGAVGIEWEKPTRSECRGSGTTCYAMNVVSEKPCPRSLYVSISLFNGSYDNIGWTNDTAQGVLADEKVRLVFSTYENSVEAARVADVSCY